MAARTRKNAPEVDTNKASPSEGRAHSASYASDKKNPGKWLIRVAGPHASKFAGREVPVNTRSGEEHAELLDKAIWAGVDEETKENVCLYTFVAKPREELDDKIPF